MRIDGEKEFSEKSTFGNHPFIPGVIPEDRIPLSRYLPPESFGVVSSWAKTKFNPGDWILDPLCGSPWTAIELANAGFNVLVAAHNPVMQFLIEFLADPPSEKEFKTALSALAFETRGEMRIEQFINSLYLTECLQCGLETPAEAFIWEREADLPSKKILNCPHCLEKGVFPTTERDGNRITQFGRAELHIARAGERIAALDDPDRMDVEEALSIYLPRAIYAILTLINRYENIPEVHRRPLSAILLAAFDRATVLWPFPQEKYRPKKLAPVSIFRENNLWQALENELVDWIKGIQNFPYKSRKITTSIYPERLMGSGNICIYRGRYKDLANNFLRGSENIPIKAVVSAIPRPNQAFWSLSAIWTGLLWGREAASRIKGVLRRKRFDWTWYCSALNKTYSSLAKTLFPDTQLIGIISEPEASFLGTILTNAWINGFSLKNIAPRLDSDDIQIQWEKPGVEDIPRIRIAEKIGASFKDFIQSSVTNFLQIVKEPSHFITLYEYGFYSYFQKFTPDIPKFKLPTEDFYNLADNLIREVLSNNTIYIGSGRSEHSLENDRFWFKGPDNLEIFNTPGSMTIIDRAEMEVLKVISNEDELPFKQVDQKICLALPGLLTQETETIQECLKSYAREIDGKDVWRIRNQDTYENRSNDILQMEEILVELGARLNFQVSKTQNVPTNLPLNFLTQIPVIFDWNNLSGENSFRFYIISTAIFAKIILTDQDNGYKNKSELGSSPKKFIVLPGGRSNLIRYKIQRDFRFRDLTEQNWYFVKFRHMRRLYEDRGITLEKFNQDLYLDPLANRDPQITFL